MSDESRRPMLLDLPAAARELSVAVVTLRRWIADGELECVRLGRRVLVRQEALEAFINRASARSEGA